MKQISAGIIITDINNMLVGHSTGNAHWDIPKGEIQIGETVRETAIRETMEEFGIDLSTNFGMIDLGLLKYTKHKDLYLFLSIVDNLPDPTNCKCDSYFTINQKQLPEIDDYKIISLDESGNYLTKSMSKIIHNLNVEMKYYD